MDLLLNKLSLLNVKILKHLQNEFVYGAHLTALLSPALVLTVQILLNLEINYTHLLIAYLITLIVYSFNYNIEIDEDFITNPEKATYLRDNQKYFKYKLIAYILLLALFIALVFDVSFVMFVLILLTGGILYTVVFKVLTKIIPAFKNFYTTIIWAYGVTFYISYYYSLQLSLLILVIFLLIFLKMFVNVAFFDLKDITSDNNKNFKTLAIILGKNNTILLLTILNFLHAALVLFAIYFGIFPIYAVGIAVFFIYTQYYLNGGRNADTKKLLSYTYLMADAEFILWPILLIIVKIATTWF